MIVDLYLPYNTYDDGDFDTAHQMSNDEFFDLMEKEERVSKNIANDFVNNRRFNVRNAASFNAAKDHNEGKVRTIHAEADIDWADGEKMSVDDIVSACVGGDVGAIIVKFNPDNMDEEFEEDINFWNEEHESINEYVDKMGEDWAFSNEPVRNVSIEYLNKAGEKKSAEMVNCRILEKESLISYVILYERLRFK